MAEVTIDTIIRGETDPISAMNFLKSAKGTDTNGEEKYSLLPKEGKECFGVGSVIKITENMFKPFVKLVKSKDGSDSGSDSD
jgi:hypothetical protein